MSHNDWVEGMIAEMNDAMTTTVSFTDTAAERERALQAEVDRLREENQYLNDLYEANEFGIVQQAWKAEVERLRAKCNRLSSFADLAQHELRADDAPRELTRAYLNLEPTDLAPEPHSAANDTPSSQPEACDTKSAKSITSAVSKEAAP